MALPVTFSSKFFPPPLNGPPVSILESAKRKLLSILSDLPDPHTRDTIHQEHLRLLTDSPGYAVYFLTSLDRYERLLNAKPVLIQGNARFFSTLHHPRHSLTRAHQNALQTTHGSFSSQRCFSTRPQDASPCPYSGSSSSAGRRPTH